MSLLLAFTCPSCQRRLAGIPAVAVATQVVTRTCRGCRERWQLVVTPREPRPGLTLNIATMTFKGRFHKEPRS